ncbi:MAG TPA: ABC transporter substrate-binding protein [Candidatus Acidoferrales bacterium]|nr:ABC transporter substrate-binding protein [Candidatus Acidoferrales bacterium]
MKKNVTRIAAPLLVLVFVLSMAALGYCQSPVKIGFITPLTGVYAALGADLRDGFLLYWSEIGNRTAGRPVEIIVEDKGSNRADDALAKARKLVEKDAVHVLAGIISTPVAIALREYAHNNKVPLIVANAGADAITQKLRSPYVFRSSFSNSDSSHPLGDWAYKQGYRRMVLMAADYGAGYENTGGIARTFTEAGGKIVQEIYSALGTADFAPYISYIDRNADVVAVFYAGADALRFVTQYAEYGLHGKIPLIGKGFLVDEVLLPRQGDAALGIVTSLQWSAALDSPQNKKFIQAYETKYKRPATVYAEQAYVAAQMIALAGDAVKGKVENQQAFLAALRKIEVDAPRGKLRLDAYHNPIHTAYIRKVEKRDGKLQNTVIASYPNTSQFWKWSPEAFMAMPSYADMKGKWVKQ